MALMFLSTGLVSSLVLAPPRAGPALQARRASAPAMLDIPRLELPSAVGAQLKEFDLKDPNQLTQAEYNTYSAAAIGGTLALMLPGALIFDITGLVGDFAFGATFGGGLAAFLALRSDGLGEAANKFGAALRDASGVSVPRLELPEGVVSAMKDLDLKDPNQMSDADYNSYSFAAIGGTLALMLPGALPTRRLALSADPSPLTLTLTLALTRDLTLTLTLTLSPSSP